MKCEAFTNTIKKTNMKVSKHHGCCCSIIPSNVIDILVDKKILTKKSSRTTNKYSNDIRKERKDISTRIHGPSLVAGPVGNGDRFIYDSKNTSKVHYLLVRKENDPVTPDPAANDVYDNCGKVREFYRTAYNYLSVDNHGKNLVMNIHYQENFNNALWSSDVDQMFFGDGDGQTFVNIARALDVIGHELTHGVVEYTAGLQYQGQSGALNEHIADVFGTVIKQFYNRQNAGNADWLIGDQIVGPRFPGKAIRSMKDPGKAFDGDQQPDHIDNLYTGLQDNGGVHINSGILNKVFYLVAAGTNGSAGLDTAAAGLLWFESLKAVQNDRCDFQSFFGIVLNTVTSLSGANRLAAGSGDLVRQAFNSVGIQ